MSEYTNPVRLIKFDSTTATSHQSFIIGRASRKSDNAERFEDENTLYFDDRTISKEHASVTLEFENHKLKGLYLKDLGSQHGTVCNSLLLSEQNPIELRDGDLLGLVYHIKSQKAEFASSSDSENEGDTESFSQAVNASAPVSCCRIVLRVSINDDHIKFERVEPSSQSNDDSVDANEVFKTTDGSTKADELSSDKSVFSTTNESSFDANELVSPVGGKAESSHHAGSFKHELSEKLDQKAENVREFDDQSKAHKGGDGLFCSKVKAQHECCNFRSSKTEPVASEAEKPQLCSQLFKHTPRKPRVGHTDFLKYNLHNEEAVKSDSQVGDSNTIDNGEEMDAYNVSESSKESGSDINDDLWTEDEEIDYLEDFVNSNLKEIKPSSKEPQFRSSTSDVNSAQMIKVTSDDLKNLIIKFDDDDDDDDNHDDGNVRAFNNRHSDTEITHHDATPFEKIHLKGESEDDSSSVENVDSAEDTVIHFDKDSSAYSRSNPYIIDSCVEDDTEDATIVGIDSFESNAISLKRRYDAIDTDDELDDDAGSIPEIKRQKHEDGNEAKSSSLKSQLVSGLIGVVIGASVTFSTLASLGKSMVES